MKNKIVLIQLFNNYSIHELDIMNNISKSDIFFFMHFNYLLDIPIYGFDTLQQIYYLPIVLLSDII